MGKSVLRNNLSLAALSLLLLTGCGAETVATEPSVGEKAEIKVREQKETETVNLLIEFNPEFESYEDLELYDETHVIYPLHPAEQAASLAGIESLIAELQQRLDLTVSHDLSRWEIEGEFTTDDADWLAAEVFKAQVGMQVTPALTVVINGEEYTPESRYTLQPE